VSGLRSHSWLLGCLAFGVHPAPLPPPGDRAGGGEGHPAPCLSRCKRMAWRDLAETFDRNFQESKQGFEGTSLMLLWGFSTQPPTHPLQGSCTPPVIPSCPGLGYLRCPRATLLHTLISSSSSSPLLQTSLPFPSISRKLPCSFQIPFFLPSCLAAGTVPLPRSISPLSVGQGTGGALCCRDSSSRAAPLPVPSRPASLACPLTSHLSQSHQDVLHGSSLSAPGPSLGDGSCGLLVGPTGTCMDTPGLVTFLAWRWAHPTPHRRRKTAPQFS